MTETLDTKTPLVLVVEDEPLIRMVAVDFLEDAGFHAIEATNADEAIATLDRYPDIAVLFTDVDMPGTMNGVELASLVSSRRPSVQIIIASGHRQINAGQLPRGGIFLQKPYDINHVTETLQKIYA